MSHSKRKQTTRDSSQIGWYNPSPPGEEATEEAREAAATAAEAAQQQQQADAYKRLLLKSSQRAHGDRASKRRKGEEGAAVQEETTAELCADPDGHSNGGDGGGALGSSSALSVMSASQETDVLSQQPSQEEEDNDEMHLELEAEPQAERIELEQSQPQAADEQPDASLPADQASVASTAMAPPAPALTAHSGLPLRTPSQRDRKRTSKLAFDEQQHAASTAAPAAAAAAATAAAAAATHHGAYVERATAEAVRAPARSSAASEADDSVITAEGSSSVHGSVSTGTSDSNPSSVRSARPVVRDRGSGVKVPKSSDHWMVVGLWVASRDFPTLPFWLPLVEPGTSKRLELAVPYKSMMATFSPKYNDREKILLHVRVVQRVDRCGQKLTGEVRYLCTDIAVSYHMGDNAFKWISFHPTIFQVCCSTWNSSLNRAELEDHLTLASAKGGMVFQAPEAEAARTFLRTILNGKGLLATCSLRQPPVLPSAKQKGAAPNDASSAGAATGAGVPSAPAAFSTHIHAAELSALPASPHTLHNYPKAMELFSSSLKRVGPMWFHPGAQDHGEPQLTQTLPVRPDGTGISLVTLSSMLGAAAAPQAHYDPLAAAAAAAAASSMGLQRSHSMPSPFSALAAATVCGFMDPLRFAPSLNPAASDLLAQSRARPFKSRSTKLKEAYERAPLHLDLLPFVQISNIPIEATDSTSYIPSVVICNLPRSAPLARTNSAAAAASSPAPSPAAVATLAAMTSATAPLQRKGSTGLRVKSVKPLRKVPQTSDDEGAGAPAQSLLLELLGAANSVKREPGTLDESRADHADDGMGSSQDPSLTQLSSSAVSGDDAAAAAGLSALDALASVADPIPAAIQPKQETTAAAGSEIESKADEPTPAPADPSPAPSTAPAPPSVAAAPEPVALNAAAPAPALAPALTSMPAPAPTPAAPALSDKVLVTLTRQELFDFQRFRAQSAASAVVAAPNPAHNLNLALGFGVGGAGPHPYASSLPVTLPVTPRSNYLHAVTFGPGGAAMPTTGVYSLAGMATAANMAPPGLTGKREGTAVKAEPPLWPPGCGWMQPAHLDPHTKAAWQQQLQQQQQAGTPPLAASAWHQTDKQ